MTLQADKTHALALLCHQRDAGGEQITFLANTSQAAFHARVGLRLASRRHQRVEEWDLETGRRLPLPAHIEEDRLFVEVPFERLQSHLLVVSEGEAHPPSPQDALEALRLTMRGHWKIDPDEDNALRLDSFRMQVDPQNRGIKQGWHKPEYTDKRWLVVEPRPFVEQIRGTPLLSRLPLALSAEGPELPSGADIQMPLTCWFRTAFWAEVVPGKLALVMDRSAIVGNSQIYLNGARLPSNAFRPTFRYDHANITCAIGRHISKGRNVLAVRVEIGALTEGVVDAFYLFGRIGVKSWRNAYLRLTAPADRGPLHCLDGVGMPFYAGTVAYTRDEVFPRLPQTDRFVLSLEEELKGVSDTVEVLINGHSLGVRAWAPYRWTGETAWLRQAKNRVVLRITNTLDRLLTGQAFQLRGHRTAPVKV